MKRRITIGIIFLAIGFSFLVSGIYRSDSLESFNYGMIGFLPLEPQSWNFDSNSSSVATYILPPRTLRMDVISTSTIDLYILDRDGLNHWIFEGKLEPIWAFEQIHQETATLEINKRNEYCFLIYNPLNSNTDYAINASIYGMEKDLLFTAIAFLVIGTCFTLFSLFSGQRIDKIEHQ